MNQENENNELEKVPILMSKKTLIKYLKLEIFNITDSYLMVDKKVSGFNKVVFEFNQDDEMLSKQIKKYQE